MEIAWTVKERKLRLETFDLLIFCNAFTKYALKAELYKKDE